jgi:hypothetical protein
MKYNDNMIFFKKCLPFCILKNKKENKKNENENENEIKELTSVDKSDLLPTNRFKNLVNNVISLGSFKNSKNKLNDNNSCKICNKEFIDENKDCDCLTKDELHPDSEQTQIKIKEKYIHNSDIIHKAIHIDKNPDKLTLLVNDIYDIVEKSTLKEDLTPQRLEKVKENLINEICVHIEDYIKE